MAAIRAAAYCRFSSDGQRDGYSIEAQLNAIKSFCKSQDLELVAVYIDEAKTGTNDNRDQFQNMISDSSSDKFDVVVVHKFDRFARDRYDSAIYKKKLKDQGIRVLSVLEPLDDSPESVILEGMLEAIAEYFSKNLARETMKGKNESAKQLKFMGGPKPPYGYTVDADRHFVIVPEEAMVVREIFTHVANGGSYKAMLKKLNERGILNSNGKPFTLSTIIFITKQVIYKGTYVYGKSRKVGEPYVVEDAVPAIVSKDLFNQVAAIQASNAERYASYQHFASPREKEAFYFLTGYIFCASCGAHYYGFKSSRKSKTKTYQYNSYRCSKKKRDEACGHHLLNKQKLEDFTIELIESCVFGDSTISFVVSELEKHLQKKEQEIASVDELNASIKKLKKQEERLLDIYISGSISKETYEERVKGMRSQRADLEAALASVNSSMRILTPEQIKSTLFRVLDNNRTSEEYRKNLVATFLDKILVYPDRLEFFFKFPIFNNDYSTSVAVESSSFVRKDLHALHY